MNMVYKFIGWFVLNYGLMNIVVFGSIFEPLRNWIGKISNRVDFIGKTFKIIDEWINCPMCFSTWGGFLFGLIIWSPIHHLFGVPIEYSWFFDGIMASGGVWFINSLVEFLEENRINIGSDE